MRWAQTVPRIPMLLLVVATSCGPEGGTGGTPEPLLGTPEKDPGATAGDLGTATGAGPGETDAGPADAPDPVDPDPACPVAGDLPPPIPSPSPSAGLVVHEWGTFTSMQGSDGATLEGMHHEDEPLPAFVRGRAVYGPRDVKMIERLPQEVTQKMETPVLYFHTSTAQDVTVTIGFPQGVITQWFPDAAAFQPAAGALTAIAGGEMTWKARVDPAIGMAGAPAVEPGSIWQPSRNVAAAPLRIGDEVEQFVFYRGLGRFDLWVRVTGEPDGRLTIRNDGYGEVPGGVLLVSHGDGTGDAVEVAALGSGASVTVAAPARRCGGLVSRARTLVHRQLLATGLHDDEARAMVDTWSHSYFGTPGLRLLYVVPPTWTDALLPLAIQPPPEAVVRTLVGRIEILTADAEQATVAEVRRMYDQATTGGAFPALSAEDRFLEARLRRAALLIDDPALVRFVDDLVMQLDLQAVVPPPAWPLP